MVYKPMEVREYRRLLKLVNWTLIKGGTDYLLKDEDENLVCSIIVTHGKNTKRGEIPAFCVRKTEKMFVEKGLKWPPKKR